MRNKPDRFARSDDHHKQHDRSSAAPVSIRNVGQTTGAGHSIASTATIQATPQTLVGDSISPATLQQNIEQTTEIGPVAVADTELANDTVDTVAFQHSDNKHRALATIFENATAEGLDALLPQKARLPRFYPFPVSRGGGQTYVTHQPPFHIFEEPHEVQNAAINTGPPTPFLYSHNENENEAPTQESTNPFARYRVHTAKEIAVKVAETGKELNWDEYITNGDEDEIPSDDSTLGPRTPTSTTQVFDVAAGSTDQVVRMLTTGL